MAQWTETQEPYVKVVRETVHTSALNPTAGEDLIIGVTFISDSGPAVPTLISSQSEFLSTYASQDVSKEYLESLNKLYEAGENGDKTLASTMWANAYRLAGSTTMLCCRASKANDMFYAKPLQKDDSNTYILRDGALLKKVPSFKIVINARGDDADHDQDGWSICVKNVGILGNRTTDNGAQYDYMVNTLPELIDQLNETSMFFCPSCSYYSDNKATSSVDPELSPDSAVSVILDEVYLGEDFIDTSDDRCPLGRQYVVTCQPDWTDENPNEKVIDLNDPAYSGFNAVNYYATNAYNSATDLRVRIRRFNHDAVASKQLSDVTCTKTSDSPWKVLTKVLDTFTKNGTQEPSASTLERDFYEVCVQDPSVADEPQFFNIGNITGRGDMTAAEVNSLIKMVQLQLPDDMKELELNYYDYEADDNIWTEIPADTSGTESAQEVADYNALLALEDPTIDEIRKVTDTGKYYKYVANGNAQIYVDLNIDPTESSILNVGDADLKKALDLIGLDEVYVTEGLCDLGNTTLDFQSYMANMAINENYFYPISTVNSTNYMTIGNSASKITQDSYKLYMSAPWDIDTASLGWQTYMSPSVLYWEAVSRNRRNNNEFAPVMGQTNGIMQYSGTPVAEFNKKSRQLLLTKKVNTVLWNTQTNAWNMNDNYTKQSADNIMSDEANSRLGIRIAKAMPVLLRQFIGWRISPRLWASAYDVIDYWFKTSILSLNYNLDAYQIIIDETNNPVEVQRQNKLCIQINCKVESAVVKSYKMLEGKLSKSAA